MASGAASLAGGSGLPIYMLSTIGSMGIDGYQALREIYKAATDDSVERFY